MQSALEQRQAAYLFQQAQRLVGKGQEVSLSWRGQQLRVLGNQGFLIYIDQNSERDMAGLDFKNIEQLSSPNAYKFCQN